MDPITKADLQRHSTEGHTQDMLLELRRYAIFDARGLRATYLRRPIPESYLVSEEDRLLEGARKMFVDCKVTIENEHPVTGQSKRYIVIDWS